MDGSRALHESLAGVAMLIHQRGHVDGWRRTLTTFDHVLTTGGPILTETRMTVVAAEEGAGLVASFDAICRDDDCHIESVYFNE